MGGAAARDGAQSSAEMVDAQIPRRETKLAAEQAHAAGPLEPGTYYVDEVNGTHEGGIGLMTITNPVAVFSDACHPTDGFYPGSVAIVDGFVTALREQQGG